MLCMWRRSCLGFVMVSSPIRWNPALTCSCPPTQSVPTPAIIDHFDVAAPSVIWCSKNSVLLNTDCPILPRPPFMPVRLDCQAGRWLVQPPPTNVCLAFASAHPPKKHPAHPRGQWDLTSSSWRTWGHGQGKEAVSVLEDNQGFLQ